MAYADALKKVRQGGYGDDPGGGSPRSFPLTPEEAESLKQYQGEIVLEVTGQLEGTTFHVSSAKYANGGPSAGGPGPMPMMQMQTQPSPS